MKYKTHYRIHTNEALKQRLVKSNYGIDFKSK